MCFTTFIVLHYRWLGMKRGSSANVISETSFPADFYLEGDWASQWERIGNAVPPLMAQMVAARIREALDACR